MQPNRPPVAIVGPTGVGKSALAERVALRLEGEIVSADSMQVYRGMDVGTAKTPAAERRVPYHCIDLVDPGDPYSAALFQHDARRAIDDIRERGTTPVVVGGTGLYVRAALDAFRFPPGRIDDASRLALERRAQTEGAEVLHAELAEADPEAAARIHPHNVRRVVRALEMMATGTSYSDQASGFGSRTSHYPGTDYIGLTMEREVLYGRIDSRVDAMIEGGLLDEVAQLAEGGYADALTAMQAIGYKELLPVIRDGADLSEAVAQIKRSSRRYAKRQLSWFRADPRVRWLDVTVLSLEDATEAALDLLESSAHRT
ncbi:tRNA (adenosine(37)-N6)-dimethylallyltransferase MiaA [bacterium]|nr:tRNA (adenosine(37)-N6)-dimethylallyltransferase MiaA [bacterium]